MKENKLRQQLRYKLFNIDKNDNNVYRWFDRHYEVRVSFKDKQVLLQLLGNGEVRDSKVFPKHHIRKILEVIYNTTKSITNTKIYI